MIAFRPYSNVIDVSDIPAAFQAMSIDDSEFTLVASRSSPRMDVDVDEYRLERLEAALAPIEQPWAHEIADFSFGPSHQALEQYMITYEDAIDAMFTDDYDEGFDEYAEYYADF